MSELFKFEQNNPKIPTLENTGSRQLPLRGGDKERQEKI
jgi:hypothetical protein